MRRAMLALCMLLGAACDQNDAAKTPAIPPDQIPRIASFSPAITATVIALGWETALVGRTPWCKSTAPVVGSLVDVDLEALTKVNPRLILIQQTRSGAPAQLEQVAGRMGWRMEFIPATSLDDIRHLPGAVAQAVGKPAPVDPRILELALERELTALREVGPLSPALLLYSDNPVAAFGEGTYLAQAWAAMGGTLAFKGDSNPNLSMEELFAMRPASIIVIHGGTNAAAQPSPVLQEACSKRGVELIDIQAPQLLRPGPELVDGLKIFRQAIRERAARQAAKPADGKS